MTSERQSLANAPNPDTHAETLERIDGTGTERDPYVLQTARDLQAITDDPGAHYVLGSDIDASLTSHWNDGDGFTPIGSGPQSREPFSGTLDGQGHEITGLHIARDRFDVGLFSIVEGGTIRNLTLWNCSITALDPDVRLEQLRSVLGIGPDSNRRIGAIAGSFSGHLESVTVEGTVSGVDAVGGLVGSLRGGGVRDCSTLVEVTGDRQVGGIAGVSEGSIVEVDASVDIDGELRVGGLAGANTHGGAIRESTVSGDVGGDENVGGVVGWNHAGYIDASASDAAVGGVTSVGGLVGRNWLGDIADSSASGPVLGIAVQVYQEQRSTEWAQSKLTDDLSDSNARIGGIVGRNDNGGTVTRCWTDSTIRGPGTIGGAVGSNEGSLSDLVATGPVIGQELVGGLVGANRGELDQSGAAQTATSVPHWPPPETTHATTGGTSPGSDQRPSTATGSSPAEQEPRTPVPPSSAEQEPRTPVPPSSAEQEPRTPVPPSSAEQEPDTAVASSGIDPHPATVTEGPSDGSRGEQPPAAASCASDHVPGSAVDGLTVVGGLVGKNEGSIEECFTTGLVFAQSVAGGIAGHNQGTIRSIHAAGPTVAYETMDVTTPRNRGTIDSIDSAVQIHYWGEERPDTE